MSKTFDIAIIGAGPAGYEAALTSAKAGLSTIIFEGKYIGGTCTNVGCIPTKSYLYKAKQFQLINKLKTTPLDEATFSLETINKYAVRVVSRLTRAMENALNNQGITLVRETVANISSNELSTREGNIFCFNNLIIATGTKPFIPSPFISLATNPNFYTNENIFSLDTFPKSVTIIGAGAIGVEFAFFFASFNVEVNLIEIAPDILPNVDTDLIAEAKKLLKRKKVKIFVNQNITAITDSLVTTLADKTQIESECLLMATGRKALIPDNNLELQTTNNGYLQVNENFQTSTDNIFAIGDVNGQSLLAHSASDQGEQIIVYINNNVPPKNKAIPSVIYTHPSLSSVGIGTNDLDLTVYKTVKAPLGFSGKAQAEEASDGWVKLTVKDGLIYGCQIFGYNSEDLLPIISLAIEKKIPVKDLADLIYAHPSFCEALKEVFKQAS